MRCPATQHGNYFGAQCLFQSGHGHAALVRPCAGNENWLVTAECEREREKDPSDTFFLSFFLQAGPVYVQCNDGSGSGTQISEDGLQSQTQTGPGCQSQTSEDGQQSQSQSQNGYGTQTQTQCSGADCSPLPPLFTLKPLEWQPLKPLEWHTFAPMQQWNFNQVQQQQQQQE